MIDVKKDPFRIISQNNAVEILSYLHPVELVQCLQVSKIWNNFAGDKSLWKPLFDACEENNIDLGNTKVWTLIIRKSESLFENMIDFCEKLKLNQEVKFKCIFIKKNSNPVLFELKYLKNKCQKKESRVNKTCIFIKSESVTSSLYSTWAKSKEYSEWRESSSSRALLFPFFNSCPESSRGLDYAWQARIHKGTTSVDCFLKTDFGIWVGAIKQIRETIQKRLEENNSKPCILI